MRAHEQSSLNQNAKRLVAVMGTAAFLVSAVIGNASAQEPGPDPAAASSAAATSQSRLSWLLARVLGQDEGLKALQAKLKAAEEKVSVAKAGFFPNVTLTANAGREEQDNSKVEPARDDVKENYTDVQLALRQPIYDFGRTSGDVRKARRQVAKIELELQKAEQQLVMDALVAYFDYVRLAKRLQYALNSENNIKAKSGMQDTLLQSGAGYRGNQLRAKKELVEARMDRVEIESDVNAAAYRYKHIFGVDPTPAVVKSYEVVNPALLPKSIDQATRRALEQNPEMQLARMELYQAQDDVRVATANMLPTLEAVASKNMLKNVDGYIGKRSETLLYAGLKMPLFAGFANVSNRSSAEHAVTQASHRVAEAERKITKQVNDTWIQIEAKNNQMRLMQNHAEIIGELLRYVRQQQSSGASTDLDVVDVETDFINAVSDAISAETEAVLKVFELAGIMGDLQAANISNLLSVR